MVPIEASKAKLLLSYKFRSLSIFLFLEHSANPMCMLYFTQRKIRLAFVIDRAFIVRYKHLFSVYTVSFFGLSKIIARSLLTN